MIKLNNFGDTIVEVLIAIAIVGMILGGAYASANRSLQAERRSQEHSEAMRVAESQLELLKKGSKTNEALFDSATSDFCLSESGEITIFTGALPPTDYQSDDYASYPNQNCKISYNGGSYYYNIWIERLDNNFTVHVRWDGAGGFKQELKIGYNAYDQT